MALTVRPIVHDIPDTQTVSVGTVAGLLELYVASGAWARITPYYELCEGVRARNFQHEEGAVWAACEVLIGSCRGFRVRLVVVPHGQQYRAAELANAFGFHPFL